MEIKKKPILVAIKRYLERKNAMTAPPLKYGCDNDEEEVSVH